MGLKRIESDKKNSWSVKLLFLNGAVGISNKKAIQFTSFYDGMVRKLVRSIGKTPNKTR